MILDLIRHDNKSIFNNKLMFAIFIISYTLLSVGLAFNFFGFLDRLVFISSLMYALGLFYNFDPELVLLKDYDFSKLQFDKEMFLNIGFALLYGFIGLLVFRGDQLIVFSLTFVVTLTVIYLSYKSRMQLRLMKVA